MMVIQAARRLFDWDRLEDSPSLQTIRRLLAALPDGKSKVGNAGKSYG